MHANTVEGGSSLHRVANRTLRSYRVPMPIVERLHNAHSITPSPQDNENVHNLVARAKDVEPPWSPSLRYSGHVDSCSSEIEEANSDEVRKRLPPVLNLPSVDVHSMGYRYEGRDG